MKELILETVKRSTPEEVAKLVCDLQKQIEEKDATIFCLEDSIKWALGEDSVEGQPFRPREDGEGAYWWRNELRLRMRQAFA